MKPLMSFSSPTATQSTRARMPKPGSQLAWVCLTQLLPLSEFLTPSGSCFSPTLAALFHAAATHGVLDTWNPSTMHLSPGGEQPSGGALDLLCSPPRMRRGSCTQGASSLSLRLLPHVAGPRGPTFGFSWFVFSDHVQVPHVEHRDHGGLRPSSPHSFTFLRMTWATQKASGRPLVPEDRGESNERMLLASGTAEGHPRQPSPPSSFPTDPQARPETDNRCEASRQHPSVGEPGRGPTRSHTCHDLPSGNRAGGPLGATPATITRGMAPGHRILPALPLPAHITETVFPQTPSNAVCLQGRPRERSTWKRGA